LAPASNQIRHDLSPDRALAPTCANDHGLKMPPKPLELTMNAARTLAAQHSQRNVGDVLAPTALALMII
jgi:hypothetical protein